MLQTFINIITIIGFIIAVLTWFKVSPRRLGDVAKTYIIKNWVITLAIALTCLDIAAIILNISSGNHNWWSYVELSWVPLYLWLIVIYSRVKGKQAFILEIIITIAPALFLITSSGRLVHAINTDVFNSTSPSPEKWRTLGICGFYFLLTGFSIGSNLILLLTRKILNEIKGQITETQNIYNEVKNLKKILESRVKETDIEENS